MSFNMQVPCNCFENPVFVSYNLRIHSTLVPALYSALIAEIIAAPGMCKKLERKRYHEHCKVLLFFVGCSQSKDSAYLFIYGEYTTGLIPCLFSSQACRK